MHVRNVEENDRWRGHIRAIFMDLQKYFDTLSHNLLIAKLGAYRSKKEVMGYVKSYLTNKTKSNSE